MLLLYIFLLYFTFALLHLIIALHFAAHDVLLALQKQLTAYKRRYYKPHLQGAGNGEKVNDV